MSDSEASENENNYGQTLKEEVQCFEAFSAFDKDNSGEIDANELKIVLETMGLKTDEDEICIMIDEAHMAKADVLKRLLTQPFAHCPIRWGLTGTVPKEDFAFKALLASIGEVTNKIGASEL